MLVFALAACGKENGANENTATAPAAGNTAKTGLAVISSTAKSADAGDKDGLAEVDSTIVAVMVDSTGKIINCKIDAIQTKINFSKEGKIITPWIRLSKRSRSLERNMEWQDRQK